MLNQMRLREVRTQGSSFARINYFSHECMKWRRAVGMLCLGYNYFMDISSIISVLNNLVYKRTRKLQVLKSKPLSSINAILTCSDPLTL